MTAVDTRPAADDLDLTPWQCPRCGYANDGIRGFCAGCRLRRPAPDPELAVRQFTPHPTSKRGNRPTPPARPHQDPAFGPREVLATVLVVLVFLAGLAAAAIRTTEHTSSPATASAPSGSTSASTWDPRVVDIVRFVEGQRGMQFKHPVPMDFLDDAAFDKKVTSSGSPSAAEQSDIANSLATLRAVGLVEGAPDLRAQANKVASQSILGLYSPEAKHVFVRGSNLTPDVRVVLAHELTHALQDQYFGLDRLSSNGDSGADTAFRALAEADASRVEDSYVDVLSSADAKAFEATREKQSKQADVPDVPEALVDDLAFPYVFGPAFVAALVDKGGNDAVNQAFKNPPQSEAQIVDPQSYLAGVKVTKVPAPDLKSGQKRIEKPHDVGQVSMLEVLGDRLPYDQAWGAVKGWAGDKGLTYRENGKVCFAGDTALKDPGGADTFEAAARAWAATMPAASVARLSPTVVDLRSCDPGPAYTHAVPQPSAFKALSGRSEFIALLHKARLTYTLATCATDGVIAKVGVGPLLALNEITDPNDPRLLPVQRATRQSVVTCQRSGTI